MAMRWGKDMTSFLNLGTPAERQEAALRKALELRRDLWDREGFAYRGAGDLLLQHGKFYTGRELPDQYKHLKGTPNQCFVNALEACKSDESLTYVEGVYTIGRSHWTPHAWCLDSAGELLEVTLPTEPEVIGRGIDAGTGMKIMGLEHWSYWGAIFHPQYVEAVWALQDGHVGMLDRPSHDTLDEGRNPSLSVSEWR